MRTAVLIAIFTLVGCSKIKKAGDYVGITSETPASAPAETPEERAARERAEHEAAIARLRDGDLLVQQWTDHLAEKQSGGGFKHHEGLTDPDPWGEMIKVEYKQKWFTEHLTVTSAGPDQKFGTADDLVRTRAVNNPAGIVDGVSTFGWVCVAWVGFGVMALVFATALNTRRNRLKGKARREHPVVFGLAVILFAPLSFFFYGLKLSANMFGGMTGHPHWGLDGFDFDLDFDLG